MTRKPSPGQLVHDAMVRLAQVAIDDRGDQPAEASGLAVMHEAGLTMPQVIALSMLRHPGPSTINALADALGLSMSATSSLVQRLVELELVTRSEDPDDRRQKLVALTRAGAALIDRLSAIRAAELGHGIEALPEPLRDELLDVLARVVDHLRTRRSKS